MTVVFLVLILLAFIINLLGRISKEDIPTRQPALENDEEELLVAKIVASCLFQIDSGQDVVIKSIKRVQ
jgi:Na+-transporting methylmalonyl-CoA/oxaloacetate decarboxylase gamma subunit